MPWGNGIDVHYFRAVLDRIQYFFVGLSIRRQERRMYRILRKGTVDEIKAYGIELEEYSRRLPTLERDQIRRTALLIIERAETFVEYRDSTLFTFRF